MRLQKRHERSDADQTDEGREVTAAKAHAEEVRLGLQAVPAAQLPYGRQDEERHHVGEREIGERVERRAAAGIGPAAQAQEGERRINLTGHQQEYEQPAEAAAGNGPLLEVHVAANSGQKAYSRAGGDDDEGYGEADGCRAHRSPLSALRATSIR